MIFTENSFTEENLVCDTDVSNTVLLFICSVWESISDLRNELLVSLCTVFKLSHWIGLSVYGYNHIIIFSGFWCVEQNTGKKWFSISQRYQVDV